MNNKTQTPALYAPEQCKWKMVNENQMLCILKGQQQSPPQTLQLLLFLQASLWGDIASRVYSAPQLVIIIYKHSANEFFPVKKQTSLLEWGSSFACYQVTETGHYFQGLLELFRNPLSPGL